MEQQTRKGVRAVVCAFSARWLSVLVAALFGSGLLATAGEAHAFKVTTHEATANQALKELGAFITEGPNPNTIVFRVKGRTLEVPVSGKVAYLAIIHHPAFFRAGVIGPDGFPDLITGQYWQHSNQNAQAADLVKSATGNQVTPKDHPTADFADTRQGTSEFRAVDFAMALLAFANGNTYPFAEGEKEQVIAFVMGYFAHGVGDSFAHSWVNKYTGGAWELGKGQGIFATFTEELKHVAVEGLVDSRVPGTLQNADGSVGGELNLMDIRAPIGFLDAFFSREVPNHIPFGNKGSSDPEQFFDYYKHIDRFYGSAVYNYWNLQVEAAQAMKNFSQMGNMMDFAEKWQPGPFLDTLLDIVDFPEQVVNEVEGWIGGDFIPWVTGGFLKCELTMGGTSGLENIRKVWDYLGGFNDRIDRYEERARIVRQNWMRLSECTAQNMIRINGGRFDAADPEKNRDACTELADRPWADEAGDPENPGLFRGSIRNGDDDSDEFLADLKSYFKGSDDDGDGLLKPEEFLEPKNGHRHVGANVKRMKSYLLGFGFTLDDLEDVLITDKHETDFDHTCGIVRSKAEHRCLNYKLAPVALPVRTGKCLVEEAICTAGKAADCLSGICLTAACAALPPKLCVGLPDWLGGFEACVPAFGDTCKDLCELTGQACNSAVDGTCGALSFCDPTGLLGCFNGLKNVCNSALHPVCDFIAGGDPNCVPGLFDCVAEGINCNTDVLIETIAGEGWAEQILSPVIDLCNAYDQARQLFERFDTVEERIAFAESHGVPITRINELVSIYERIGDKFEGFPPEYFVNLTFLREDLLKDPQYLQDYLTALQSFETANSGLAPGSERTARENAAKKLRSWYDATRGIGTGLPLSTPDLDPALDQAKQDLLEFERIVESLVVPTVAGPTARAILADVGPDMPVTFNQFFNTVQGIKIIPLNSTSDIDALYVKEQLTDSKPLLPWNDTGKKFYSPHCRGEQGANLYCDVMVSFDDPNCAGPNGEGCKEADRTANALRNNWVGGRGVVAWNDYNPNNRNANNVLTSFPLAATQQAYDSLYTRVFDVPGRLPGFFGFEDPARPWTSGGPAQINPKNDMASEGQNSLTVTGCGYTPIRSPRFNTTELGVVGTKIAVDVMLPQQQGNQFWYGDVQMFVDIPAANLNNAYVGINALTGKPRGSWQTLEFTLPANIKDALLKDYPDAQITLAVNLGECNAAFRIDNLRFTGELQNRTVFSAPPAAVSTNPLFGFEQQSDWTVVQNSTLGTESQNKVQGSRALAAVNASGYGVFRSRAFTSTEVGPISNRLAISVYIPRPQPNPYWTGDLQMSLTCPTKNINNAYIGYQSLTNLFGERYNRIEFQIPAPLASSLNGGFTDCRLSIALNVSNGAGTFLFDNMAFVQ